MGEEGDMEDVGEEGDTKNVEEEGDTKNVQEEGEVEVGDVETMVAETATCRRLGGGFNKTLY